MGFTPSNVVDGCTTYHHIKLEAAEILPTAGFLGK